MTVRKHYIYLQQTRDDNGKITDARVVFVNNLDSGDENDAEVWHLPTDETIAREFILTDGDISADGQIQQDNHAQLCQHEFTVARIIDRVKNIEHEFIIRQLQHSVAKSLPIAADNNNFVCATLDELQAVRHDGLIYKMLRDLVRHDFQQRPRYLFTEIEPDDSQAKAFQDRALHALHQQYPGILGLEFNSTKQQLLLTMNSPERSRALCHALDRIEHEIDADTQEISYEEEQILGNPVISVPYQLIALLTSKAANEYHRYNESKKAWQERLQSRDDIRQTTSAPSPVRRSNGSQASRRRVHFDLPPHQQLSHSTNGSSHAPRSPADVFSAPQMPLSFSSDGVVSAADKSDLPPPASDSATSSEKQSSSPLAFEHVDEHQGETTPRDDDLMFDMAL